MDPTAISAVIVSATLAVIGGIATIHSTLRRRDREDAKRDEPPRQMIPPPSAPGWREDTGGFPLAAPTLTDRERRDVEDSAMIRETWERVRSMSDTSTRSAHHQAQVSRSLQSLTAEVETMSLTSIQIQTISDRVRGIDQILGDVRAEIRRLPAEQARELEAAWTRLLRMELAFLRTQPTPRFQTETDTEG